MLVLPDSQFIKWVNLEEFRESGASFWTCKPCFRPVTAGCLLLHSLGAQVRPQHPALGVVFVQLPPGLRCVCWRCSCALALSSHPCPGEFFSSSPAAGAGPSPFSILFSIPFATLFQQQAQLLEPVLFSAQFPSPINIPHPQGLDQLAMPFANCVFKYQPVAQFNSPCLKCQP